MAAGTFVPWEFQKEKSTRTAVVTKGWAQGSGNPVREFWPASPMRRAGVHTHPARAGPMPAGPGSRHRHATGLITGQPSPTTDVAPPKRESVGTKET